MTAEVQAKQARHEVLHIRCFIRHLPEFCEHLPMPIGKRAISETIKQPKDKPGTSGKDQQNKVSNACSLPYPPKYVEDYYNQMKNQKEIVEEVIPGHAVSLN